MSKSKKVILLALVAIICSIVAGYAVYSYCTPKKTIVYAFNGNYSAGTQIESSMLSSIEVDSNIVINGKQAPTAQQYVTSSNYDKVISSGDSLLNDVYKGQALTLSTLSVASGSSVEMNMKPTAIAVTIPVDNITGVTSSLRVGSRVNIYSSTDKTTELILQSMRIISVNAVSGALSSITVETTHEDSLKLIYAATYTDLYLGLVDSTDYEIISGNTIYNASQSAE